MASGTGAATTIEHRATIVELSEGRTQAACSCGWRSAVFGADKSAGTMDDLSRQPRPATWTSGTKRWAAEPAYRVVADSGALRW